MKLMVSRKIKLAGNVNFLQDMQVYGTHIAILLHSINLFCQYANLYRVTKTKNNSSKIIVQEEGF